MQPEPKRTWNAETRAGQAAYGVADLAQTSMEPDIARPTPKAVPGVFEVAFICTANRFRSALAEGVCGYLIADLPARTYSFGSLDLESAAPLEAAARVAGRLGIDLSAHRSRHLEPGALASAGLVVGFERMHLEAAVVEGAAPPDRAFLLTELGSLLETAGAGAIVPQPSPEEMVQRLQPARQLIGLTREFGAVPDPAGASIATQEASAARVAALVVAATRGIFGAAVEPRARELELRLAKLRRGGSGRKLGLLRRRA